jgi:hypothetical protein
MKKRRKNNSRPFRAGWTALALFVLLGGMLCGQSAQPAESELRISAGLTDAARAELDGLVRQSGRRMRVAQGEGCLRIALPARSDLACRLADWLRRHGLNPRPVETVPVMSAGEAICIAKVTPRPLVQAGTPVLLCSLENVFDSSSHALTLRVAPAPRPPQPLGEHHAGRAPPA